MKELKKHVLEAYGVTKRYGQTIVLENIDFTLDPGEIVAVIGQNGAGKSTFSKIIAGVIEPTAGKIYMDGKGVKLYPPRNALRQGVVFIPQELAYVPRLTVAENIMLGHLPGKNGLVNYKKLYKYTEHLLEENGISIDVHKRMEELKLGEKQLVEIAKALAKQAKVILLDEPTASLTDQESKNLFGIVHRLAREKKVGILYISHRMDEVFRFSDRIDVFRNGKLVASEKTIECDHEKLIYYMLGQEKETLNVGSHEQNIEEFLKVNNWNSKTMPAIMNVNFSICKGQVLSLFGVRGCGYERIAEGLVGLNKNIEGTITYKGVDRKLFSSILDAKKNNVVYVPPDRKKQGLVLEQSILQNMIIMVFQNISRWGFVSLKKANGMVEHMANRFSLVYQGPSQRISELSGGNQQKVLLGSRLNANPELLVLQEPTRGVDIGARLEIHRQIRSLAEEGCAVVIITSDIEEAVDVSDRMIVLRDGYVVGELTEKNKTQQEALRLASGNQKGD